MRTGILSAVAVLMVAAIASGPAMSDGFHGQNDDHDDGHDRDNRGAYAIGLWGDLPYSVEQATVGIPNMIADMNAQDLAFTVHDGDLKAGSNSPCDDALYTRSLGYFNALKAPAVFTPGDNDWTDYDRTRVLKSGEWMVKTAPSASLPWDGKAIGFRALGETRSFSITA